MMASKPLTNDLKVNIQGPVRRSANQTYQRAPQSATQPNVKGLNYNPQMANQNMYMNKQAFSPTYPAMNNSLAAYPQYNSSIETLNQQLLHQNKISQYPIYPSQQPQSAGLSRKPPGFEFVTPKGPHGPPAYAPSEPMVMLHQQNYEQFQPMMQPQTPYYPKHSASPLVPPSKGYDMSSLKKQPQSATMAPFQGGNFLNESKGKNPKNTVSQSDTQEGRIFEVVKECEELSSYEEKVEFLQGKLCEMLFTQTGSRFIQKQLSELFSLNDKALDIESKKQNLEIAQKFITFILSEIGDKVDELMIDRYGNYFFQELITRCDSQQRMGILESIQSGFIEISTDKKGTHTVQRLIDMINTPEEEKALHECVKGQVVKLCLDAQGTHVMQKYVKVFPEEKREFVIDELLDKEIIIKISKNSYGLAVMKKVIKFTENFDSRRRLMTVISKHTAKLVQDPYGNYVLQESLDNWNNTDPELHDDNDNCFFAGVFKYIIGKIEKLAVQKFSSNVIEKCLERANEQYRKVFIKEILYGDPVSVMKNSYGNYVFQKSLALAKGIDKFKTVDIIFRNFPTIHDQKIKLKWVKLLKKNLKQEDVLEAEEEQEQMNLDIDQTINFSHKFKLINDEISRYDSSGSKRGKGKKMGAKESSYANSQSQMYQQPSMGYGGPPASHSYYHAGAHTGPMYGGENQNMASSYNTAGGQYPSNFQTPPGVYPGQPPHGYGYQNPGHNFPQMTGDGSSQPGSYPEGYFPQGASGYGAQGFGGGYKQ
jgi:hypothetical protein